MPNFSRNEQRLAWSKYILFLVAAMFGWYEFVIQHGGQKQNECKTYNAFRQCKTS